MSGTRTTTSRSRSSALIALVLAGGLALSACADETPEASDTVAQQEAQRYRANTDEQERINKANAELPGRPGGIVDIEGTSGSLTAEAATRYEFGGSTTTVNFSETGEDQAFQRLCAGEIDLVDSSRPISRAEWDACRAVGLDVVQFQVAADAVVLAIKSETDVGGDCLTTAQVQDIFRAGSPITDWSQLGLDEVRLETGGPDTDNNAFGFFGRYVLDAPEPSLTNLRSDYQAFATDNGTRDWVVGGIRDHLLADRFADRARRRTLLNEQLETWWHVLRDAQAEVRAARAEVRKGIRDKRPPADRARDQQRLADAIIARDAARAEKNRIAAKREEALRLYNLALGSKRIVDAIRGNLAFFRFSYYELYEDQLRPFEITVPTGERNCIFPSQRTIVSGEYPLARQLLITTTTRSLQRREVTDFLKFYVNASDELAADARLVALPANIIALQNRWLAGETPVILVSPDDEVTTQQPEDEPEVKPAR
ncbi:MAG: substrate-binding domain-containing protein [Nocardioides sp.]|nr:substrate-binding domain-containing protein [Nocardioides sp.]